jgi:hypothetical protein
MAKFEMLLVVMHLIPHRCGCAFGKGAAHRRLDRVMVVLHVVGKSNLCFKNPITCASRNGTLSRFPLTEMDVVNVYLEEPSGCTRYSAIATVTDEELLLFLLVLLQLTAELVSA